MQQDGREKDVRNRDKRAEPHRTTLAEITPPASRAPKNGRRWLKSGCDVKGWSTYDMYILPAYQHGASPKETDIRLPVSRRGEPMKDARSPRARGAPRE